MQDNALFVLQLTEKYLKFMTQVNLLWRVLYIYTKFSLMLKRTERFETKNVNAFEESDFGEAMLEMQLQSLVKGKKRKVELLIRRGSIAESISICLL